VLTGPAAAMVAALVSVGPGFIEMTEFIPEFATDQPPGATRTPRAQ
jgi:hypothetical protein